MLLQMVFGRGYVRNISPHGVYTDIKDVDISDSGNLKTPVGVFNGKTSSISTPRFINDEIEAIYVTFNFLEKDGGDYQVLFSNCGALTVPYTVPGVPGKRTSSVEILLDKRRQEIIFIGKTDDVAINSVISRVPYSVSSRSLTDFSVSLRDVRPSCPFVIYIYRTETCKFKKCLQFYHHMYGMVTHLP